MGEDDKIKNIKELIAEIRSSNATHTEKILKVGGHGTYFRALVAQVLWLTFLYLFAQEVVPVKSALVSNAIIVVFLTIYTFLWTIIKKKLPSWIDEVMRGEIFYKFNVAMINYSVTVLLICIFALLGFKYIMAAM